MLKLLKEMQAHIPLSLSRSICVYGFRIQRTGRLPSLWSHQKRLILPPRSRSCGRKQRIIAFEFTLNLAFAFAIALNRFLNIVIMILWMNNIIIINKKTNEWMSEWIFEMIKYLRENFPHFQINLACLIVVCFQIVCFFVVSKGEIILDVYWQI